MAACDVSMTGQRWQLVDVSKTGQLWQLVDVSMTHFVLSVSVHYTVYDSFLLLVHRARTLGVPIIMALTSVSGHHASPSGAKT